MRLFAAGLMLMSVGTSAEIIGGSLVSDVCGVTVTQDLRLDADAVCPGDGIIAGADAIRIDLNGHTVQGSGTGTGVVITGRTGVTVQGGVLRGFAVGVRLNTATGVVIRHVEFIANGEGLDAQAGSIGNAIKDNIFREHTVRAIMLRGNVRENDIKGNTFTGNRIGMLVFAGADNQIKDNDFAGSSLAAIRVNVLATGNVFKDNSIAVNEAGIEFLSKTTGSAAGNELKDNALTGNSCGIKGPTTGNTLKDNRFENNLADACS